MDYLSTHESLLDDRDRQQAEADLEIWRSAATAPVSPQCGQCKHFAFTDLESSAGFCRKKVEPYHPAFYNRTVYQARDAFEPICELFTPDGCPF